MPAKSFTTIQKWIEAVEGCAGTEAARQGPCTSRDAIEAVARHRLAPVSTHTKATKQSNRPSSVHCQREAESTWAVAGARRRVIAKVDIMEF